MKGLLSLLVAAALFIPVTVFALTAEEAELLRKAGVSEERIAEMGGAPAGAPAEPAEPAESDEPAETSEASTPTAEEVSVPAFNITDWNEDGINDVIAGTNNGELNVYINTGSNENPEFDDCEAAGDGDVDAGTVSVPCIVDWNNDGLKDVLMGNRGGTVYLFLNSGSNQDPDFDDGEELMDGDVDSGSYSSPTVVDWNGDGRKDLILGDFNGHLNVYINIGTDSSPEFNDEPEEMSAEMFNFSTFNYTTPFATRNYINGLFDILTGCGDGRVYRFRNAGTPEAPRFLTPQHVMLNDFIFELNGNTNVIACDWDKDGKEDLMVSNRTTTQTQGTSSSSALSSSEGTTKVYSKVYFLKNVGTNKEPRYDRAVEILRDYVDINL